MKNLSLAVAYYTCVSKKNIDEAAKYVHEDVEFSAPLAKAKGKTLFLDAVRNFSSFFKNLTIREQCESQDKVMLAYDVEFPDPIGHVPSAVLLSFHDGLISRVELFYDARPFNR
ncbi:MAG: nuclear transport factor 2 family protein [Verrucomicrobia bacterium]|nr:nuclear transport factor 2 family protein [Verrucomicrobiota bacterium]